MIKADVHPHERRRKIMKRFWGYSLICCLLLASLWANGSAITMWDQYWGKEGYAVELTQDDLDDIEQMWEKIDTLSLGSGIRETAEIYTLEDEYNDYLQLTEPVMERYYDDVGAYIWVPGLPDEQSISQYQALCIGMKALCDQYQQKPADFIHYYPRFSYETSDPDNPIWKILWIRYDTNDASISYNVAVHAYTGNVIGVSKRQSVG